MAARAADLGDVGESSPEHWEHPLGTADVHVAIAVLCADPARLETVAERARRAHQELDGITVVWRQDCYQLPTGRTSFGFKDGIGQPAVEGSGKAPSNPHERPLKAGEIILGYPDETGEFPPMPARTSWAETARMSCSESCTQRWPHIGNTSMCGGEPPGGAFLGAKMVGRWQAGPPSPCSPERDDPELGGDPRRNNDFLYVDDPRASSARWRTRPSGEPA